MNELYPVIRRQRFPLAERTLGSHVDLGAAAVGEGQDSGLPVRGATGSAAPVLTIPAN